jgi:acyl carrier protein
VLTGPVDRNSVLDQICVELERIISEKGGQRLALGEDTFFSDIGIASLDLAELISSLETLFDVDPFAEKVAITSVRSVRNLCDAYLACMAPGSAPENRLDKELRAIRERAQAGER